MKPLNFDLNRICSITYLNDKTTVDCPKVLKTIFNQYCMESKTKGGNECSSTNYDEGFKRDIILNSDNGYLTIRYHFYDKNYGREIDSAYEQTLSSVYVTIFSNTKIAETETLGLLDKSYFLNVNSTMALKDYYNSEYGIIRPIFNSICQKGEYSNVKYFITPLCRVKDEYGGTIDPLNATVNMNFRWSHYTIALYESTTNYELFFYSPTVLKDVEEMLSLAESQYSK